MSPTIFRYCGYRFFFFSREETRMHVHIFCSDGEAKFWIEPKIVMVTNYNLSRKQIKEIGQVIEERRDEIVNAWNQHFGN